MVLRIGDWLFVAKSDYGFNLRRPARRSACCQEGRKTEENRHGREREGIAGLDPIQHGCQCP